MGNHRVHLVAVGQRGSQLLVLLLDDTLGCDERDLLRHTHHKLLLVERLRQEVAGSHLEAVHEVLRRIQGGQEDDGDILRSLLLLQHGGCVEAVHVGHHHVKQYQVGMLLPGHFDAGRTVVGGTHLELLIRQQNFEQQHVADHIVDNQNFIIAPIYFAL